jgi:predicted Zn-dependent peptidase
METVVTKVDRNQEPHLSIPEKIIIRQPEEFVLDNGLKAYVIDSGEQEVVKLEIVFQAGMVHEKQRLIASAANLMIDDGTSRHSAAELSEVLDYYGAYLQKDDMYDYSAVSLFVLGKFFEKTLLLFSEVLFDAIYPEKELNIFVKRNIQRFEVAQKKVSFVSKRKFIESLYGENHPYGYAYEKEDYEKLNRDLLFSFHRSHYKLHDALIIISGKIKEKELKTLNSVFGNLPAANGTDNTVHLPSLPEKPFSEFIPKQDAIQSSIRIGRRLFSKTHPDANGITVLNTLLGGYFGSRLMSNLRENKGYTYGINSSTVSLLRSGYFLISTETGTEVTKPAIQEIYHELKRLREEPVGNEELQLVKNYLTGSFLRSMDGPFALASKFKRIKTYGLGYEYYEKFLHTIRTIDADEIMRLANLYFRDEYMNEIVVGALKNN